MATEFLPGWYVDPSDSKRVRYWNGAQWTKDTWSLDEVDHLLLSGPAPPVSIDVDDSASWTPPASSSHRRPRGTVLAALLVAVAVAAALWVTWMYLQN